MEIREKALELFYKFNKITSKEFNSDTFTSATSAKQCALICVDEILRVVNIGYNPKRDIKYWKEVKQEIEKL